MTTITRPDLRYDAFVSYSHAADGRLAPALQHAVQRFATPWYRLRSLRLFRDQTGLSASPGLWSSIEDALARADWFVLLASPDAAASVWVKDEVSWWLTHRDRRRLLIVVTDGTFEWEGPGRARGSALPEPLGPALAEEPRWIDMRWARHADQVEHRDPRFREAVADLAATLRDQPKDSLIGEDVRQHRRSRRLAVGAVAVLAVLALVVAGLVVVAARQQAAVQTAQREQAAQSMLVEADAVRSRDPVAALQLGAAAHRLTPDARTEADLVQSLTTPFLAEVAGHSAAITDIAWSPDGRRVATVDGDGRMIVHEMLGRDGLRSVGAPIELAAPASGVAFTADGAALAVTTAGRLDVIQLPEGRRTSTALPGPADLVAGSSGEPLVVMDEQLFRRDPAGGVTVAALPGAGAVTAAVLAPDGRLLATASPSSGVLLWDVAGAPQRLAVVTPAAVDGTLLVFDPGAPRLLVGSPDGTIAPWDLVDPRTPRALPPAGQVVERTLTALDLSSAGRVQAAASIDGSIVLTAGLDTLTLRAHRAAPLALAFSPDGTRLLSGALDGGLVLWDTGPGRGPVLGSVDPGHDGALLTAAVPDSPDGHLLATGGNDGVLLWEVPLAGQLTRVPGRIDVPGAVLALAFAGAETLAVGTTTGHVSIWDVADPARPRQIRDVVLPGKNVFDLEFFPDGATLATAGEDIGVQLVDVETGAVTGLPDAGRPRAVEVSPDAHRLVVSDTLTNSFVLWNVVDPGRPVIAARSPNGHETVIVESMALTADGRLLVSAGRDGKVVISAFDDPDRAREIGEIDTARRVQTRSDAAGLLTMAVSRDGRTLVAAGEEGLIGLWDLADPSRPRQIGAPLQELQGEVYSVALLPDGSTLVAGGQDDRIAAWDLRPVAQLRRTAVDTACHRAGAPLSPQVWGRLAPGVEYRDTCAG